MDNEKAKDKAQDAEKAADGETEQTAAAEKSGEAADSGKAVNNDSAAADEGAKSEGGRKRGRKKAEPEEDDVPYEKRRRPWTKDRVLALVLQIVIVLFIIGAIVFYRWYTAKHEEYQTGVMSDGNFCVAYICSDGGARQSFELEGDAVTEQSRFAFSEFYYTRIGRIYSPVSEGKATLTTVYTDKNGNEVHEHIEITVDSSMGITYTEEPVEKEDESDEKGS